MKFKQAILETFKKELLNKPKCLDIYLRHLEGYIAFYNIERKETLNFLIEKLKADRTLCNLFLLRCEIIKIKELN